MLLREQAIDNFLNTINPDDIVVSSTGKISRELYDLRENRGEPTNDFYMQGSMGCAVPIAFGIAMNTDKQVYALTGDGALLMKLGALATVAKINPPNLHIIVFNNNCHESTGGQPTAFKYVKDFVAKYCQIINVQKGTKSNLGRPKTTPEQITDNFRRRFL
jgi:phosphonopyruvate decarboxylase